jgi:hypothetical protein
MSRRSKSDLMSHHFKSDLMSRHSKSDLMSHHSKSDLMSHHSCQDVQLTDFEVELKELERHVGLRFHSRLDRTELGRLCVVQGCRSKFEF